MLEKNDVFYQGIRDAIPIGLGYFAVSFALGITMRNSGFTPLQGFVASLLNNASAGEYAGVSMIAIGAPYIQTVIMTCIANARYFLMSFALSQKLDPALPLWHRLIIGFDVTDELFGISIAQEGYLKPAYYYGAMLMSIPFWAIGTALGVFAGNLLPDIIVASLSVALFGMFLAVIIPQTKKDKHVLFFVLIGFLLSFVCSYMPYLKQLQEGIRTIVLTVVLSAIAAVCFPRKEEAE